MSVGDPLLDLSIIGVGFSGKTGESGVVSITVNNTGPSDSRDATVVIDLPSNVELTASPLAARRFRPHSFFAK